MIRAGRGSAPARGLVPCGTVLLLLLTVLPVGRAHAAGPATAAEGGIELRPEVVQAANELPPVRIHGRGWGHGVGMSQYGAYAQARAGWSATRILDFYYPGTALQDDERSDRRIRANIQQAVASTTFRAEADVPLLACGDEGAQPVHTRLGQDSCVELGTAAAAQTYRVCPGPGTIGLVRADGSDQDGDTGQACDREPELETTRPVVRVAHDGTTLHTPPAIGDAETRRFSDGWRDLHRAVRGTDQTPVLNAVQDLPSIEVYLQGIAEVPSGWGVTAPAALEAQAIAARTFALSRPANRSDCACQIRTTAGDQVYTGDEKRLASHGERWVDAVQATEGQVVTYGGDLAATYYSSSHGGRTENVEDSWAFGTTPVPYLISVEDRWSLDAANPLAQWEAVADNAVLAELLSQGRDDELAHVERLEVVSRTEGGTPRDLEVSGVTRQGAHVEVTFSGHPQDSKAIAGGSLRRRLPLVEGGAANGRLHSSQITDLRFAPFTDDDTSVHEFAISWAHGAGIVRGVDAERFAPDQPVTRAQMATFLVGTFDVPAATGGSDSFPDVAADHTHAASIEAAAEAGLAGGYRDGTFGPDRPVTREQMATFLSRALGLEDVSADQFEDVTGENVHAGAIGALAGVGVTRGCDQVHYCPGEAVLRGQLSSFLHRVVTG